MLKLDRDVLNNVPVKRVATATMGTLFHVQDYPPEEQILGMCTCFLALCERMGVEPQDVFTITKNILTHDDGLSPELRSVRSYMHGEIQ